MEWRDIVRMKERSAQSKTPHRSVGRFGLLEA